VPEHRRRFSPEFREEAVRLVIDSNRPIAEIARELGMHDGTLGNWVAVYRRAHAQG
jgi:transposase-like protein